jgi:hypothetical protein
MDPITIAMLASAAVGAGQTIFGGAQATKGQRQEERLLENRPQYDVPTSIQNLDKVPDMYAQYLSEIERTDTVPGQRRAEQQLRQSTAQGIKATTERSRTSSQAQGAATDLYSNELQQLRRLELESIRQKARQRTQAMQMYGQSAQSTAQIQGQYQDQAFRLNEMADWEHRMRSSQGQQQAGYNMIGSGLDSLTGAAQMYGMSGGFGGGGQGSQSDFLGQANQFNREMKAGVYDVPQYNF